MIANISVNDLLEENESQRIYRILWISEKQFAYWIDIEAKRGLPMPIQLSNINDDSYKGVDSDPLSQLIPEDTISERDRHFRDQVWERVKGLLAPVNEPAIYDRKSRGVLLQETAIQSGLSQQTLYKYIRRYWQRGKNKNAFLPDYQNCGARGKERTFGEKKSGRPGGNNCAYRNVDAQTKRIFEAVVKKYYHTRNELSFTAVYELMIRDYYTQKSNNGLQLQPIGQIPTLGQFKYWYTKQENKNHTVMKRKGESNFSLNYRAITGKSDYGLMGPGAKYQIDATVGDIYLVSQFNRADIIGRPILYFVIDAFSRMVTGMYVGLEGPSWAGAMMALANAASDKVKFCAEYGIEITESDWPCRHIPEAILGDRGEMESKSVETLINSLGVRVENAPPYRADLKGIVEQYFHTVNTTVTAFLPGHVKPDMSQRGGRDYRLDAKLDLRQFTKLIIQCVLYHNNEHYMDSFDRSVDMIADDVQPIPLKLWEWGIAHCSGLLRSFPGDVVRLCLMPTNTATVTAKGIRFKGIYYLCDLAVREQWLEHARARGSFKMDISYDPRDMSRIYLRNVGDTPYEVCRLANWQEKYSGKYLDEIIYLHESEKLSRKGYSEKKLAARVNLSAQIEEIVSEATEQARQTPMPKSKSERTKNIRANRAGEKEALRREESFQLPDFGASPIEVIPEPQSGDESDLPYLSLIRKKAKERQND